MNRNKKNKLWFGIPSLLASSFLPLVAISAKEKKNDPDFDKFEKYANDEIKDVIAKVVDEAISYLKSKYEQILANKELDFKVRIQNLLYLKNLLKYFEDNRENIKNHPDDYGFNFTFPYVISKNKKYNLWSTTGGHPKYKETSLEGIQTEVEEELGLKIKKKHLTLFKTLKTEDDFIDLYYIKIPHTQKFYLQKDEVDAIKWANISEIKDLIKQKLFLPPHIDFLKELIEWRKNER